MTLPYDLPNTRPSPCVQDVNTNALSAHAVVISIAACSLFPNHPVHRVAMRDYGVPHILLDPQRPCLTPLVRVVHPNTPSDQMGAAAAFLLTSWRALGLLCDTVPSHGLTRRGCGATWDLDVTSGKCSAVILETA